MLDVGCPTSAQRRRDMCVPRLRGGLLHAHAVAILGARRWQHMLTSADQRALLTAMDALSTVERRHGLVDCVRSVLHTLLPHGVFVFGAGRVKGSGFTDYEPLGYQFPLAYLDEMRAADGTIQTPSIVRWLRTGQPQLFESSAVDDAASKRWLQSFNRYDL